MAFVFSVQRQPQVLVRPDPLYVDGLRVRPGPSEVYDHLFSLKPETDQTIVVISVII